MREASETIIDGFKTMVIALATIVLAWAIGVAAENVGTAQYIVDVMVGSGVPGDFLPLIIFVAFTTGRRGGRWPF